MDLYTASALGIEGVVKCAITKNPTLALRSNEKKWTPIMYACTYCQAHIVDLLVNCIPSCVYSVDTHSQTPLIVAAKSGNLNIVKMVAQVSIWPLLIDPSTLTSVVTNHMTKKMLKPKPALLDCKDEKGRTALFYAVYYGHIDIIYYLVKFGADINARDCNSQTALMTAVQNGSENVVALLLALGAKTELVTKDTGLRAIDLARRSNLLQLIILLSVFSVKNLRILFCTLRLDNYVAIFKENDIDLDRFFKLKESDLKLLGISKIGPRKIMTLAIDKFNYLNNLKEQLQYSSLNQTEWSILI